MSSFIQKVRKAVTNRSTINLRPKHLQSAEFMQNNVIYSQYVIPTDHIKINPVFAGRCAALTNPSFIDTLYHVRGFYVPHSVVWKRFDDFVNGNSTYIGGQLINNGVPTVSDEGLTTLFLDPLLSTVRDGYDAMTLEFVNSHDLSHECDFVVNRPEPADTSLYYGHIFTQFGRYVYKLLISLGYKFNFTTEVSKSDRINAFPLLSYLRVYLDYFIPSLWYQTSQVQKLLSLVYESTYDVDLTSHDVTDTQNNVLPLLKNVFQELFTPYYPSSYQTSSWSQPQSPLGHNLANAYSQVGTINDMTSMLRDSDGSQLRTLANRETNGVESTSISTSSSSQASLASLGNPWVARNLQKIADWLTRTRFSGSDKLVNILTRFGVKPNNVELLRSRMVGHFTQPLVVVDINATSTTYGSTPEQDVHLGDYAGKMFSQPQKNRTFDFSCDDYGCIIITSQITPADIDYFQGMSRDMLKLKPLDFFQPEFDKMGTQLQSRRELISGLQFDIPAFHIENFMYDKANGYVPRYSEYNIANSTVSGDFAVNHMNKGYDSYHHFRSLFRIGSFVSTTANAKNAIVPNTTVGSADSSVSIGRNPELLQANSNLLIKSQDGIQYNRIFNVQNNNIDHIYTMYYFNIFANRPVKSISDSLDLQDGSNDKVDISKDVVEQFK